MIARVLVDNITKNEWKAEWGLSVYIEHDGHKILLDTGTTGVFAENADSMGIDLSEVEFGVLSHAHYDHADGMEEFFRRNSQARFYLRAGSGENCYKRGEDRSRKYIGIRKGYLEKFADRIAYVSGDYEAAPGVVLRPHKTIGLSAAGKKAGMYVKVGRRYLPDSFAHEQSLVISTEKGLVIFNSCSHGGADTIIREAERTWPGEKIHALIGGFHLFRSSDQEVEALARRIKDTGIEKIYTGHCTGERAMEILKAELKENAVQLYTGLTIEV